MSVIGNEIPGPLLSEVAELERARAGRSGRRARARPVGHPRRLERQPRVRVQAPADPGGRLRIPALGAASARAPARSPPRSSAPTPTGSTSAPPSSPTTARPPATSSRQPAGTPAPRPGPRSRPPPTACATGAASATWRASSKHPRARRAGRQGPDRHPQPGLAARDVARGDRGDPRRGARGRRARSSGPLLRRVRSCTAAASGRGSKRSGAVSRQAVAAGDPGRVLTASTGVAYASWIAGSLREAVADARPRACAGGRRPGDGRGLAFVCPLAHAFGIAGSARGYMGELDEARRDFDRAIELAREHDDPETESAAHANLALLEAERRRHRGGARQRRAGPRDRRAGSATWSTSSRARRLPLWRRPARGASPTRSRGAESNLATIRERRIGLYYEPLLLATIARSQARARRAGRGARRRRGGRRHHGRAAASPRARCARRSRSRRS